jgi:colicin import membrane protein
VSAATLEQPPALDAGLDPFRIGWRYVHTVLPDGTKRSVQVPLTEEDFLHPQEDDEFMCLDPHEEAASYLRYALREAAGALTDPRIFTDMRIDWQCPGILPHRPDAAVFENFPPDWDEAEGTVRVGDLGATIRAVFEVTSPTTRHVDFGRKLDEYLAVSVPYYIVLDLAAPAEGPRLLGFRLVDGRYREMRQDATLGLMVPRLGLWFRWADGRLRAADEDGKEIIQLDSVSKELRSALSRADAERERAEAEAKRAEAEAKRAEAEAKRADALARELAELKARLTPTPPAN